MKFLFLVKEISIKNRDKNFLKSFYILWRTLLRYLIQIILLLVCAHKRHDLQSIHPTMNITVVYFTQIKKRLKTVVKKKIKNERKRKITLLNNVIKYSNTIINTKWMEILLLFENPPLMCKVRLLSFLRLQQVMATACATHKNYPPLQIFVKRQLKKEVVEKSTIIDLIYQK